MIDIICLFNNLAWLLNKIKTAIQLIYQSPINDRLWGFIKWHFIFYKNGSSVDLTIEEHYTDTAGYTDQVFGLSHLLGFRFAPRLRDISDAKLYTISPPSDFQNIKGLLRFKNNTNVIKENFDDVLRLAHSIREGRVSGSLIMGKLGSYARQNKIATAL